MRNVLENQKDLAHRLLNGQGVPLFSDRRRVNIAIEAHAHKIEKKFKGGEKMPCVYDDGKWTIFNTLQILIFSIYVIMHVMVIWITKYSASWSRFCDYLFSLL